MQHFDKQDFSKKPSSPDSLKKNINKMPGGILPNTKDYNCKPDCKVPKGWQSCDSAKSKSSESGVDGAFCRKCNEFLPMAEPDGEDGKCLCWGCANRS